MSYTSYSYTKTGYFAGMPIGSLVGFSSSTMPSGWIKCNGVAVSNTTGLYNNLINLGIGTGALSSGTYTPPDLTNCIMMGIGSGVNALLGKNDPLITSNTVGLTTSHIPAHVHTVSLGTAYHSHSFQDYFNVASVVIAGWTRGTPGGAYTDGDTQVYQGNTAGSVQTNIATAAATMPAHTHTITFGASGSSNLNLDFTNPSTTVFFILKYK